MGVTAAVAIADPERLPFAIREGEPGDLPIVHDSWFCSAREGDGRNEGRLFSPWQKADQREILARATTRLRVVAPEGDPGTVMGWAAVAETNPACVYFVYTRFHSRQLGITKMLLGDLLGREVLYGARPARVWDAAACRWVQHPIVAKIPPQWRYVPRINHREVGRAA